jgi:3-deoxy-D-manno-octulosonate 8-phosphate phosphatase KdsC-like HAD superfamily phosphatase
MAACPMNAVSKVKAIPGIIPLQRKGGEGAMREFVELILDKNLI